MKKKILLVEDDLEYLELLKNRLSLLDIDVVVASDGEEGFKKAKEEKPDLIITDIKMPKADGFNLVKEVKKEPAISSIPIIVLTAYKDIEDMFRLEGVKHYILKTEGTEVLIDKINQLLGIEYKKKEKPIQDKLPKLNILIVDTDSGFIQELKDYFDGYGCEVFYAFDVLQALGVAKKSKPDIVICDIRVPAGGGFVLVNRLESMFGADMPQIIFTTSNLDIHIELKANNLGIRTILKKPLSPRVVLDKIRDLIKDSK